MRHRYVLWVTLWRRWGVQRAHVSPRVDLYSILDLSFGEPPFHALG